MATNIKGQIQILRRLAKITCVDGCRTARQARSDERACREHVSEEQRSLAGWIRHSDAQVIFASRLKHILKNLPHKPGIYKMKNNSGQIIYIGKAKDLKKRVSSYFQINKDKDQKTIKMVEQIADIEYIEVGSELESLILETSLIKEFRPKYNILMRDDKNYVYIKITVNEEYPRIFLVRKVNKDKARYFGPKTAAHKVIKTLKVIKKIFPYNHCQMAVDYSSYTEHQTKTPSPARIEEHRKRCLGPCIYSQTPLQYRQTINQIIDFLEGNDADIKKNLKELMVKAALEKKFEQAANLRDKLKLVEEITENQRIIDPNQKDLDIINFITVDEKLYFNLFQLRNGKLIGQENFIFNYPTKIEDTVDPISSLESAFIEQYYQKTTDIPKEILIPSEVEDKGIYEKWLSDLKGQKVTIIVPERGKKNQLLDLSFQNAQSFARQSQAKWQGSEFNGRQESILNIQHLLNLPNPPKRIECYDISHFSGTETVASMVVFENGFPKKEDYRKFKLHQQTDGAPNDFASMEETLTRRLKYLNQNISNAGIKLKKISNPKKSKSGNKQKKQTDSFTIINSQKEAGKFKVQTTPSTKILITDLEINSSLDLKILLKKISSRYKTKRIYLQPPDSKQNLYEENGFEQIRKLPEDFAEKTGYVYLVYDLNKHLVDKSFSKKPDLIIIDGGKGQLSSAIKPLQKNKLNVPFISLAKKEEKIFLPGKMDPILLSKTDPILHLIQHLRDEAHRFAVSYHKNLRLKTEFSSALDNIPGLGPALKKRLLNKFGSIESIINSDQQVLSSQVGPKLAGKIKGALK